MEKLGIIVDLAHLSPTAIDEILELVTRPIVVSHTGVRGTCDNRRNLSDQHIRRIAAGGGVIGFGYWETAACGRAPKDIAAAIGYVVRLVGPIMRRSARTTMAARRLASIRAICALSLRR